MSQNQNILRCESLCIGYSNNVILKDLTFSIDNGDFLIISGENGSGKSTLIKVILGLINPISGSFKLFADKVGYLPQQSEAQKDFPASVIEVVLSGFANRLRLRFFYNKQEKIKAIENLERFGMGGFANRPFFQLSGGQRQRVLLARCLCASEEVIFLDEPTSGLDAKSQNEMYDMMSSLNKNGTSIVMVTHDKAAEVYANKLLDLSGMEKLEVKAKDRCSF